MPFTDDVRAQPSVLRGLVAAYRGTARAALGRAAALLEEAADRPLLVVGMGSSLTAGRALSRDSGPLVIIEDAGELLHYGLGSASRVGVVIAISQSGRSFETLAAVERIRASGVSIPVIALVNDEGSPLAAVADVALPLHAGAEANVATKTYVAAVAVLMMLQAGGLGEALAADLGRAADAMQELATPGIAEAGAAMLGGCRSLAIVGRGPSLGSAHYAALTTKESAAIPAEAMSGGAFRHGPLELAGAGTGVVVLAPDGVATRLGVGLALETAGHGSPTWLLVGEASAPTPVAGLLVTCLPALPEPLGALATIVPLQLAAAALARAAGRVPGVTRIATKVTDRE